MREIKFDAIYKPTGEHFKPVSINFNDNTIRGNFDGEINDWCHFSLDGKYGDVILRQYTGLKDKNGKEIYESDILEQIRESKKGYYTVVWHDNGFKLEYKFTRKYQGEEYTDTNYLPIYQDYYLVIGNIYENPELLK